MNLTDDMKQAEKEIENELRTVFTMMRTVSDYEEVAGVLDMLIAERAALIAAKKRITELEEELVGVKKERDDLHNEAEDATLKLSSILTQLGHARRSDDMFKDSMLLIRKLQSENKIDDVQSRLWTLELEVGRLGGNINAKYYHEDYVDELQSKLKSLAESIRERAAKIIHSEIDRLETKLRGFSEAFAYRNEWQAVIDKLEEMETAIRQMELISA